MNEWKEYKLGEIGTLQRGRSRHRPRYAFHLYGGKYPFIQTGEVKAATKYIKTYENTYSEAGLAQSKIWPKGTLCITIAANIAEIAILDIDACFPDSILGFTPNLSKCDIDFIFYSLTHYKKELQAQAIGSVQDNINVGTFENITFPLPPLLEQRAIASILSSLDDKIDLLHRQNKTLEQLAETVFRQWFLEENTSQNSKIVELGDLIDTISHTYKFTKETVVFLNTSDIYNGEVLNHNYSEVKTLPGQAKKRIKKDDILYSEIRPANRRFAYINYEADDYVVSTKLMVLRSKGIVSNSIIYFYLTQQQTLDWLQVLAESRSGTFPQITFTQLCDLQIRIPEKSILQTVTELFEEILNKISKNKTQIRTLQQLRDTLLPKLMSGEVRVKV